jgi:hypothetical protein
MDSKLKKELQDLARQDHAKGWFACINAITTIESLETEMNKARRLALAWEATARAHETPPFDAVKEAAARSWIGALP